MSAETELLELTKSVSNFNKILLVGTDLDSLAAHFGSKATVAGRAGPETNFSIYGDAEFDLIVANNAITLWGLCGENVLHEFLYNTLRILKHGGTMIVRQNMSHDRNSMPYYTNCFDVFRSGKNGFKFSWLKCLDSAVEKMKNWRDFCWCLQKADFENSENSGMASFRDFLDKSQYSAFGIQAYEWIFGEGFISPGGIEENRKYLSKLAPKSGQLMLDVGCGIGGGPAQAANEFGTDVLGLDLSSNMLNTAINRAHDANDPRLRYMLANAMEFEFPANHFDTIYSKDSIIHIDDKYDLFKRLYKWLKPGGKIMIIGYAIGPGEQTAAFKAYLASRQYSLTTASRHAEACKSAGFQNVSAAEVPERLNDLMRKEIANAENNKEQFLKKFSQAQYDKLLRGWHDKIDFIAAQNFSWMVLEAEKPF